jgi:hypothetical protein
MVAKLPKYRRGIGIGRTIAPKSGVPTGVTMLPRHNIGEAEDDSAIVLDYLNGDSLGLFGKKALRRLLARRYFSRVWVLQEVALARQAVLVCGSTTVPWSCLTLDNLTAR